MKELNSLLALVICAALAGCGDEGNANGSGGDGGGDGPTNVDTPPLELTTELCDDPSNMTVLLESPSGSALFASGQFNEEQVERMIASPTEGPFYMVNLIRYREQAVYADGRETNLTGREANALYNPVEFISAIGARVVFNTEVDDQIDGEDIVWDDVAIVEYPCPVAFFAMISHPEFQERAIHKDAGVETTIVMPTDLEPTPPPADPDQSEATFPPTLEDPAFDLIHVMDFHDIAQYEPGAGEPERTGEEAWAEYQASGQGASNELGHYRTASLIVQGVLLGDDRDWDEIQIIHMSSQAGFQALLDDETRNAGKYHRAAALQHNYSMITFPMLSQIPFAGDTGGDAFDVTPNGTGTLCQTDDDCPGDGLFCLSDGGAGGFCTPAFCGSGTCEAPYVCCHDCSPVALPSLPFEDSACIPDALTSLFTEEPVSCSCD